MYIELSCIHFKLLDYTVQVGVLHRRVSAVDRERIRRAKAEHCTAHQYVDSAGRKRCKGIKHGLKASQAYTKAIYRN